MSKKINDALRFSFGMRKEELVSARSTPKFPSIELNKDSKDPSSKHTLKSYTEKIELSFILNNHPD